MAPRTGKAKVHKLKGDKKKAEKVVVPVEFDIGVILPDESQLVLKGISTDRIVDVRRLLAVHVEACHITNYSLHHEVKGPRLRDAQEVLFLKPPILTLVEEDYTEEQAVANVRRLLDIFSCTTHFGASSKHQEIQVDQCPKQDLSEPARAGNDAETRSTIPSHSTDNEGSSQGVSTVTPAKTDSQEGNRDSSLQVSSGAVQDEKTTPETGEGFPATAVAAAREATERRDMSGLCPPSELKRFYEFFSLSHLTRPILSLCRSAKQETQGQEYFVVEIRLCNGKLLTVAASAKGFRTNSKQLVQRHTLVALLKCSSQAFSKAYEELLKGFLERNKFGNIPYGLRSNTWVVPPVAADAPQVFPPTPAEDETWGGNGGGQGRAVAGKTRPWAQEFAILAKMACETVEQRRTRDRKAFRLHNLFVDVAVTVSVEVIKQWDEERGTGDCLKDDEVYQQETRNLTVTVSRDVNDASKKSEMKIDGSYLRGKTPSELAERNFLKGITADQSTTIHDIHTFGVVVVRHRGYTAVAEASGLNTVKGEDLPDDLEIEEQPEGGANALNVNSLRTLLHTGSSGLAAAVRLEVDQESAESLVQKVIENSLVGLESESVQSSSFVRLELGACWLQHLQTEGGTQETAGKTPGEGDQRQVRKLISTSEDSVTHDKHLADVSIVGDVERRSDSQEDSEAQLTLRIKLGEAAFKRLQESGTGLHLQTIPELMDGVRKYYEVALSKLVADFGSLELAPVDGRTLSDFMHARGLQMRSLGRVAELASKLPHVQSLCEHEMVARALKHVLRAVVASTEGLASAIASVFNFAFGTIPTKGGDLLWKWVEVFVRKRFNWELSESCRQGLRPYAVLRGLCHKIGIELVARDYQFECSKPIKKLDVISMVPVYKHVSCSSADARTLLESCKTALDKGKGEEAIRYGTKALAKLIAVCGPNHRMTAGAYSLLAVVLYHTGDYNQAMIYQQKALDINERELGLEHPDTIKSYGDVAVFYYRLQHTELAIKYVTRALYLLHLVCGPSHPNTAATYINVAMMEEGMGNVHVSLRYLHEALQCNVKLLGPDHTQTAATYHAMAIVLSMMDAYVLSVQHEQKTLEILENKLGKEDPRTQDSAAWLQYFDSKAAEQQEAGRNGTLRTDSSIASKGHLSVPDLLEFINSEGGGKSAQSKAKSRRTKTKSKGPSVGADLFGEGEGHVSAGPPASAVNTSVEEEVMAVDVPTATIPEVSDQVAAESFARVHCELELQPEAPTVDRVNDDDGWQSAAPRGRSGSGGGRKGWRGSNSVTGAGNQAVRGIAGVMGEAAGVPDLRKAPGSGTSVVYGDRTWRGVSVTRGRALSPVGNSVGNAPAEVVRKASPAVVVKLNPNTQAAVSDGAESDRKAEDGADSPADTSVKSATSTSSAASSVDGSSPRPSRAALSYKEAALAPAVAGTLAKVVSGLGGAVDIKVSKVLPSDGKVNTHVQGNNGFNNIKQTVGKTPSANADISYKASNGVADGNTNGKVAESKLVEDMDGTSEEDHLEKKSSEGKKLVAPGKRWADFDLEPTDLAECDKVTSLTTNGFGETDKVPKLNGNGQRFGRINTPTDRDGQKFGRKSYWKDVDTHGSAKGGSKAREESNGCADGHKPLVIPAKVGNGWFKSIRKESDSDSRTSQNGFGNGHSVSANASSFRKNEQQPTENGFRVVGNGSAENVHSSSSIGHEALGNRRAAVEANGPGKNGYKYGGQYSAKSADGQQSTRVKNGEKAVWNIKFGRVAESDMDIEPAGLSECGTAVSEGVVSSVETDLAVRSDSVVDSDSVHGEQPEVQEVEHIKASDVTEPQHDAVGVQLSGSGQHDAVQPSGPEQHPVEEVVVKEEDAPSSTPAMSECSGDNNSDSQDTSPNQHDSAKRLSAAAIPFTPMSTSGSRVVAAVTPFKDGKAPVPVSMSAVRPPVIPAIPNTIAVTPIRKVSGLSLVSPDSNNQLLGVVVPSNQPTVQFVFPPTVGNQAQLAPSVPGSIEETVSPSAHSSSMNPYAQEYIPRTMNPNAAVFIPGSAWQSISLNGGMALVSSQSQLAEVGKEDADAGLQSFGNGPFRPWEVPPMVYGEDGSFAEDLGEAQKEFSAGTGENHSSGKSLGSPGSFGGNSELEGCSEEEGCNPSVVKYENAVLFGNPPDAMGSWKQEIPCM